MGRSINVHNNVQRILALDPSHRGVAYAVLEGNDFLVDWGMAWAEPGKKRAMSLDSVRKLLRAYEPDVVVVEHPNGEGSRRCQRVRRLIESVRLLCEKRGVRVRQFSRNDVRIAFGVYTKEAIAAKVAERFRELSDRLPPHRKLWMAEDHRMHLFDAVALACTYRDLRDRMRRGSLEVPRPRLLNRSPRTGLSALIAIYREPSSRPISPERRQVRGESSFRRFQRSPVNV